MSSTNKIVASINPDTVVLTASQRLSRHLVHEFTNNRLEAGESIWQTPQILPWQSWVQSLWISNTELMTDTQCTNEVLLNKTQELLIWEDIISNPDDDTYQLMHIQSAARTARDAWLLLRSWDIQVAELREAFLDDDAQMFLKWAEKYASRCRQQHWLDSAGVIDAVTEAIEAGGTCLPEQIILAGFDEFTPQQDRLWNRLRQAGVDVEVHHQQKLDSSVSRFVFADADRELQSVARWARGLLEKGEPGPIGVIVPDLKARRDQVEYIFEDILQPGNVLQYGKGTDRPFNLSLGKSLQDIPVIWDALAVLALSKHSIPLPEISHILGSHYLSGGESEAMARARVDARLHRHGDACFSLNSIRYFLSYKEDPCPVLSENLEQTAILLTDVPKKHYLDYWSRLIIGLIKQLGWPGERGLDSHEYQATRAFLDLLQNLSTLANVSEKMSLANAIGVLRRLAMETVFQPESPLAPIQIMGLLESSGLEYRRLWITGMNDETWPPVCRPNPFLPVSLQRDNDMPHASTARELEYSKRISERLLHSATEVIVSHAENNNDMSLRVSPVFADIPEADYMALGVSAIPLYMDVMNTSHPELEALNDSQAPAYVCDETSPGGAGVFRDQSACPFRACAIHRLGAMSLDSPSPGIDPRDRGIMMHNVMGSLWMDIKSQQELLTMDIPERASRLSTAVNIELDRYQKSHPDSLRPRFYKLEKQRLEDIVSEWLELESQRPAFEVISPEKSQHAEIAGLPVVIRPDRVDRLDDGRTVLIDYKTGYVNLSSWFGERPEEPQMPVYCIANKTGVAGLAYGVLQRGNIQFQGAASDDDVIPGLQVPGKNKRQSISRFKDWHDVVHGWTQSLEALAMEYINGDARVRPKTPAVTCKYCDLQPLCRIYQADPWLGDE